ncbi:hypothetical protein [Streptomyces roseoverticillatus]|uniref:hypothetical protein n=1 Tax=Streptomyces roseoverticillatus TaxID=66429 RepID=UPI0004C014B7|nr:hypothetical protein [Streptomyces roseoverticillatus]
MFEIRIICDPADVSRISAALNFTFATEAVREYPARVGRRTRLYAIADHHAAEGEWPSPTEAYANAPDTENERAWVDENLAAEHAWDSCREFWLRQGALWDRIALREEADGHHGDACVLARQAGRRVMDMDGERTTCDTRAYLRQQYARFLNSSESE